MTSPDARLNLHEAAELLGVHYMTVYRYVRTGRLPAERRGAQWAVDPADLAAMRAPAPSRPPGPPRTRAPEQLVSRLVAGAEAGAWTLVDSAMASGASAAEVHLTMVVPAMHLIGERWASGALTVADEHRATTVALRLVGRLGPRFARRGRKRGTVVIGAPAGEEHGLPSAIVGDLLRGAGYAVLDLGADAPADAFAETALGADRLRVVAIGATTPGRDDAVRATVHAVRTAGVEAPILVGGGAVAGEEHARRLGADRWSGPDGPSLVATVDELNGRR